MVFLANIDYLHSGDKLRVNPRYYQKVENEDPDDYGGTQIHLAKAFLDCCPNYKDEVYTVDMVRQIDPLNTEEFELHLKNGEVFVLLQNLKLPTANYANWPPLFLTAEEYKNVMVANYGCCSKCFTPLKALWNSLYCPRCD